MTPPSSDAQGLYSEFPVAFPVHQRRAGYKKCQKKRSVTRQKTPTEADRADGAEKK